MSEQCELANRRYALPELRLKADLCGIKYKSSWKKETFVVALSAWDYDRGLHLDSQYWVRSGKRVHAFVQGARTKRLQLKCTHEDLISQYWDTWDTFDAEGPENQQLSHGSAEPSHAAAETDKDVETDKDSAYASSLSCPICCTAYGKKKILQCPEGHVLCEQCNEALQTKSCPTCRRPIVGRNRALENLLAAIAAKPT